MSFTIHLGSLVYQEFSLQWSGPLSDAHMFSLIICYMRSWV